MSIPEIRLPNSWFRGSAFVVYLAGFKLLFHILTAANYGLFTDELYFLACGEHLALGYVDMPPLTAVQAWLARRLFGESPYAIHLLPAIAGAGLVLITGALTRQLGGQRYSQGLAALAALVAPGFLGIDAYLSMNSIEPLLVAGSVLLVIRIIKTDNKKLWLAFGVLSGLGMLNKHTMLLFGFAIIFSLLLTAERRIMLNWWFLAGGLIALLIFMPNFVWMWQHHFPHLEALANIRQNQRNVSLSLFGFMSQQVFFMHPAVLPIWLAGLWRFLVDKDGRRFRLLGLTYLFALGLLLVLDGRTYYLLPAYPMLIAGGAIAIEQWLNRSLRLTYVTLIAITGIMAAPLIVPILEPERYIRYTKGLGISQPKIENRKTSELPQLFADRFGWPDMAQAVANAYYAIPVSERERTAIFAKDYGQAGAIDFYGPKLGLPKAISGHLTYWYWGPREYTGEIMLVMGHRREVLEAKFNRVEKVGEVGHPYAMASQHWELFLCRDPKGWENLQEIWPQLKNWN